MCYLIAQSQPKKKGYCGGEVAYLKFILILYLISLTDVLFMLIVSVQLPLFSNSLFITCCYLNCTVWSLGFSCLWLISYVWFIQQSNYSSVCQTELRNAFHCMLPPDLHTQAFSLSVSIPQRLRVMGSLLIIMFVFIITAVLVKVPLEPLHFFSLTMVKIVIINCEPVCFSNASFWIVCFLMEDFRCCSLHVDCLLCVCLFTAFGAVLQGSLFGMAGLLPASYTTPIMSGQGLAGTFAAFAMICAIASLINKSLMIHQ